jgi:NAD(P)-dependent dehydrogenase (short-subunit alcohol dehydrogenase family)
VQTDAVTTPAPEAAFSPDRVVVVGADSAMGVQTVRALAAPGRRFGLAWQIDPERAEVAAETARQAGAEAVLRRVDLADPAGAAQALGGLADEIGGVDALAHVAGRGDGTPFLDLDLDTWREVMAVDLDAAFVSMQVAARRMVAAGRGGRIVVVTSVHEHAPRRGFTAYSSAKAGLGGLVRMAALELARHGITVNAVAPGAVDRERGDSWAGPDRHVPGIPVPRVGTAREIGATIAFLCGADAGYTTGSSYVVDGGMLLMGPHASELPDDGWRA